MPRANRTLRRPPLIVVGLLGISLGALVTLGGHQRLMHRLLEAALNHQARALFGGSIHVGRAHVDRRLRLTADELEGFLQTPDGPVPVAIRHVSFQGPITDVWVRHAVLLRFEGARCQGSNRRGIHGVLRLQTGPRSRLELQARVDSIGLEEFVWLSPTRLRGLRGEVTGSLGLRAGSREDPACSLALDVREPGGTMPASLLDLLAPALPTLQAARRRKKTQDAPVDFRDAHLEARLPQTDRVKIVLSLRVPESNVAAHLNLEVRVDVRDLVGQCARVLSALRAT